MNEWALSVLTILISHEQICGNGGPSRDSARDVPDQIGDGETLTIPTVSVIIPVYNGVQYLDRMVSILKGQTFSDFETIFVVDSRSTDGSAEAVKNGIGTLRNCRVLIQYDDKRLGGARNIGFMESVGSMIWFLDIDDVPSDDFLKIMVKTLKDHDADLVICNFTYSEASKVRLFNVEYNENDIIVMDRHQALVRRSYERLPVQIWSKLIRRELISDNGIEFEGGYAEDIKYTYVLLSHSSKVCYYKRSLYSYQQNKRSICNDKGMLDTRGNAEIDAYNDLEEYFRDSDFMETFGKRSALVRIRSSGHMSRGGLVKYSQSRECREMCRKHLRHSPEAFWFLHFPRTYHLVINIFFRAYYYKDGRSFTR